MADKWNLISEPIPEDQKFIAFIDANLRVACVSSREPNFRKGFWSALATRIGLVRPKPTHWVALHDLPKLNERVP